MDNNKAGIIVISATSGMYKTPMLKGILHDGNHYCPVISCINFIGYFKSSFLICSQHRW
jgi:hypothetical protein